MSKQKTEKPEIKAKDFKLNGRRLSKKKLFDIKEEAPKEEEAPAAPVVTPEEKAPGEVTKIPVAPEDLPPAPQLPEDNTRPTVIPGGLAGLVGPMEAGVATVAKKLAPQLASDQRHLQKLIIDERKLAVLNDYTQVSVGYFLYRGQVDEIRFWNYIANWELVSSQAIDGRGRTDILNAVAYAASGKPQVVAKKPNVLARHTYARNWKAEAAQEGKVVVEE